MRYEYPSQTELELPLLRAIAQRGGTIWFSFEGEGLENALGDEFGLSKDAREHSKRSVRAKGHRVWRNHIQYVRLKLVDQGYLDNGVRDRWKLTATAYKRLGIDVPTTDRI